MNSKRINKGRMKDSSKRRIFHSSFFILYLSVGYPFPVLLRSILFYPFSVSALDTNLSIALFKINNTYNGHFKWISNVVCNICLFSLLLVQVVCLPSKTLRTECVFFTIQCNPTRPACRRPTHWSKKSQCTVQSQWKFLQKPQYSMNTLYFQFWFKWQQKICLCERSFVATIFLFYFIF